MFFVYLQCSWFQCLHCLLSQKAFKCLSYKTIYYLYILPVSTNLRLAPRCTCHIRVFCRSTLFTPATFPTWCSFSDMRTPGATTFRSRSMSANTHSSLGSVIRKSPLNRACKPYKNDSRLERSEKRLSFECYCTALSNENEGGPF